MDSQAEPCPCPIPSDCVPIPPDPTPIPSDCVPIPLDPAPISSNPVPIPSDCIPIPSDPAPIPSDPIPIPPDPSPCLPADSGEADPVKIAAPGAEPFTIETPGMCVMKFPLQNSIVAVELCPPEPFPPPPEEISDPKTCPENRGEIPRETPTLEVVELGMEEVCGSPGDPCGSRSGNCVDPLRSRGFGELGEAKDRSRGVGDPGEAKDRPQMSPFRLNSCTSSIVERCLARCQSWFRGKN